MPRSRSSRRALGGGLVALALALGGAAYAVSADLPVAGTHPAGHREPLAAPAAPAAVKAAQSARTESALVPAPEQVTIPRLQVSAPVVERVGVITKGLEKGLLGAPGDYHHCGWYEHDGKGVLVIDGHVGFASGSGPLAYIGELRPGDAVFVRFASGERRYRVSGVYVEKKGHLSPRYFSSAYDGDVMLITCDYLSPFHAGHFADNVFVIAKPVGR